MKPSAPSKVSWDQQLVSMPYTLPPSPSLSSTSPVILVFKLLSSFEARRFASRRAVSETVTCARMQRSWSAPDTARPLGPGDSQGPTCPLDGCALSSEAGNTPATPGQSPRPSGWLRPPLLSSLGLRGHQRGSAAYGQEGGLACGVPSPPGAVKRFYF